MIIRPFSRDSRESRDSRDSSSEKTPFVIFPRFPVPKKRESNTYQNGLGYISDTYPDSYFPVMLKFVRRGIHGD